MRGPSQENSHDTQTQRPRHPPSASSSSPPPSSAPAIAPRRPTRPHGDPDLGPGLARPAPRHATGRGVRLRGRRRRLRLRRLRRPGALDARGRPGRPRPTSAWFWSCGAPPWGSTSDDYQLWTQNDPTVLDQGEEGDEFGLALAAGDFNGDGCSDLAIGVPFEDIDFNGTPRANAGAVNVLYGSPLVGLTGNLDNFIYQGVGGVRAGRARGRRRVRLLARGGRLRRRRLRRPRDRLALRGHRERERRTTPGRSTSSSAPGSD